MKYQWWQQLKNIYHLFQAHFWRVRYGRPDEGMKIYGVTGTNGKTTTSYILASILGVAYGKEKIGMLTTISFRIGKKVKVNKTKMTALDSRDVFEYLRKMKAAGIEHVVLEITSHALDQNRLHGLQFVGAIITNLAREHLDYHKTMEQYAQAKKKIVDYIIPDGILVGKGDDEAVNKMLAEGEKRGLVVKKFTTKMALDMYTPLSGEVNQENALAASLLAQEIAVSDENIVAGVEKVKHVPGRMEWIKSPRGVWALIDYAVTPDALDKLYRSVKKETKGKVWAVLGACGLRDRGKRSLMAKTVARYADEIVLTREDPWTEPEEQIFHDLEKGIRKTNVRWQRIVDRQAAIRFCLRRAHRGDVVVVTGKGAEVGMAIGKKILPWNDREVIEGLMKEV